MAKPACWIELRYGWGLKGIPVAQTANPRLLHQAKETLLAEARRRAEISQHVDTKLGFIEEQEWNKLRQILDVLIP
jgi:hypothetical protein